MAISALVSDQRPVAWAAGSAGVGSTPDALFRIEPRPPLASFREVNEDLIEVIVHARTIGYIETAGPIFVSLSGPRYDIAEEISQSLTVHRAAMALLRKAP